MLVHSVGTWALGHSGTRALAHTWALGHLEHWGTRSLSGLGQAGIWALAHSGTWALETLYLADSGTHYYLDIHQYSHRKCYWKTELYSRYNFPFRKQSGSDRPYCRICSQKNKKKRMGKCCSNFLTKEFISHKNPGFYYTKILLRGGFTI